MRFGKISTFMALVFVIGLFSGSNHPGALRAYGAPSSAPVVGIWSNACNSFNITVSSCGSSLSTGSTISVQINVTNVIANEFNGYEFFLYYDPTFLSATSADTTSSPNVFSNSVIVLRSFAPAGTVHLVGACLACYDTGPGTIVNINFQILAVGVSPLTLAAGLVPNGYAQSFTELGRGTSQGAVPLAPNTADG